MKIYKHIDSSDVQTITSFYLCFCLCSISTKTFRNIYFNGLCAYIIEIIPSMFVVAIPANLIN